MKFSEDIKLGKISVNSENLSQKVNQVPKIARTLFTSEFSELESIPPILKIEPQLAVIPNSIQLTSICEENTQSFSENTSDILSPDFQINHQGLQSHLSQVSPGPSTQYNQFLSGDGTPSSPKQENPFLAKILFTPALIRTRIDFEDEDGLNTSNIIHHGKDTIKKEANTKSIFVPNPSSGTLLTSLINQHLNSQQYPKSSFNPSFKQTPRDESDMINMDTSTPDSTHLIFNLPRFNKDYIILEVRFFLLSIYQINMIDRNLVMVFLVMYSNVRIN